MIKNHILSPQLKKKREQELSVAQKLQVQFFVEMKQKKTARIRAKL